MSKAYAPYSSYKTTRAKWLTQIPSHWEIVQSRRLFGQRKSRASPDDRQLTASQKYGIIYQDDFVELEGRRVVQVITGSEILKHVEPNDFVMSMRSFQGGLEWCRYAGSVSSAYIGLIPIKHVHAPYFAHLFKSKPYIQALQSTSNLVRDGQALRYENFSLVDLPIVSLEEQQAIATFLDHETTKIDRLIAKQERLIELLKEKRQAVISHAVTKGLNPDVPMKDSGVEWLGEVPAHWVCKSYRYATRVYRGKFGHRPRNDPEFYDGDYPFIQTGDIAQAAKNISEYKQTLNEKGKSVSQKFLAGTLVMAIAANIGDTAILGFEAYAPDSVVGFKPKPDVVLEFLRYSLMAALPALQQTSTQSAQANLNIDRIGSVKGVFPPVEEQTRIIAHLDSLLEHYGLLENKAKEGIALMQEHRIALISAVVTGKIDVRGWQKPDTELEETATAVSA